VVSRLGVVRYQRRLYRCARCGREHAWLDGRLGLVGAQTGVAAQLAALLSVELPERRAVGMLKQLCGVRLGAATAWRNRQRLGARARGLIRRQTEQWLAPVGPEQPGPQVEAPAAQLIVREADGVMLRFVDGWHEVKVGESHGLGQPQPQREGKRKRIIEPCYCALRGAPSELGRQLQALSLSQGLRQAPASEFISDGGGWMAGLAGEALSWSRWTLDFYHASQQVAAALGALHGVGSPRAQREHRRLRRQLLKQGGNARVRRSLQAQARRKRLKPDCERAALNVIGYLERHEAQTQYAELRNMNWPIASGEIEGGGCKLYIQQRFKRPGARWTDEGFANLEALRHLAYNQQWNLLSQCFHSKN